MNEEELCLYELPTWAEFVGIGWIGDLIAKWLAWTVNRKLRRYERRLEMRKRFEKRYL